jgi:hypothetical protein
MYGRRKERKRTGQFHLGMASAGNFILLAQREAVEAGSAQLCLLHYENLLRL